MTIKTVEEEFRLIHLKRYGWYLFPAVLENDFHHIEDPKEWKELFEKYNTGTNDPLNSLTFKKSDLKRILNIGETT